MKLKFALLFLAGLLLTGLFPGPVSAETLQRNETVYVNLDATGVPRSTTVVTWLKSDGQSPVTDYNRVRDAQNIKGPARPTRSGDRFEFDSPARHIFYRGQTDRPLPLSVSIDYQLDGQPISPAELAGQSGRLTIHLTVTNQTARTRSLRYQPVGRDTPKTVQQELSVPFVVMVGLDLPLRQYSNLETPDGVKALVGETFKLKWIVVPLPEDRITLHLDAENIDLPAFMITATPKMVPLPEEIHQIKPQLNKIYDGLDQLGHYLGKLHDGARQIADGNRQVYAGMQEAGHKYQQVIQALDAQIRLVKSARKINRTIRQKIQLGDWLPVIDQMDRALQVENQLLQLLIEGGPFPENVVDFMVEQTGQKPPRKNFPANLNRLRDEFAQTQNNLKTEKLPQLKKLRDGSGRLADGVQRIKQEGVETIQTQLSEKSEPLIRKLAQIDLARKMADQYDRFTGLVPDPAQAPASSVQFIMKTPGSISP